MKKIKDYHHLYLKSDVSSLADAFEKFRKNSLKNYRLCPSDYYNTQAWSWDVMLNITKVKLELLSDPDMHAFFEKGMRGGISNRYNKPNNKYLKSYDLKQELRHII